MKSFRSTLLTATPKATEWESQSSPISKICSDISLIKIVRRRGNKKKFPSDWAQRNELLCNDKKGDKERRGARNFLLKKKLFYGSFDFFFSFSFHFHLTFAALRRERERGRRHDKLNARISISLDRPAASSPLIPPRAAIYTVIMFNAEHFHVLAQLGCCRRERERQSFPYLPLVIIVHLRFCVTVLRVLLISSLLLWGARWNCCDENFNVFTLKLHTIEFFACLLLPKEKKKLSAVDSLTMATVTQWEWHSSWQLTSDELDNFFSSLRNSHSSLHRHIFLKFHLEQKIYFLRHLHLILLSRVSMISLWKHHDDELKRKLMLIWRGHWTLIKSFWN